MAPSITIFLYHVDPRASAPSHASEMNFVDVRPDTSFCNNDTHGCLPQILDLPDRGIERPGCTISNILPPSSESGGTRRELGL